MRCAFNLRIIFLKLLTDKSSFLSFTSVWTSWKAIKIDRCLFSRPKQHSIEFKVSLSRILDRFWPTHCFVEAAGIEIGKNSSQQRPNTYFPNETFSLHQAIISHCPLSSLCSILLQILCGFCTPWAITDLDFSPPLSSGPTHSLYVSEGSAQA